MSLDASRHANSRLSVDHECFGACQDHFVPNRLQKCAKCRLVTYYSPDCQVGAWAKQKKDCKGMRKTCKNGKQDTFSDDPEERKEQLYDRGFVTLHEGSFAAIEVAWLELYKFGDKSARTCSISGTAYFKHKKREPAFLLLQQSILRHLIDKDDIDLLTLYFMLGLSLVGAGRPTEALENYEEGL